MERHTVPQGGLLLVEVDAAGQAVAGGVFNLDLATADPASITVAAGSTAYFSVLFRAVAFELALDFGWNLFSLPIQPLDPRVTSVLGGAHLDPVWEWDPAGFYSPVSLLQAKHGFWAYCPAVVREGREDFRVTVLGTLVDDRLQSLAAGWNLVGPVAEPPFEALALPLTIVPSMATDGKS